MNDYDYNDINKGLSTNSKPLSISSDQITGKKALLSLLSHQTLSSPNAQ